MEGSHLERPNSREAVLRPAQRTSLEMPLDVPATSGTHTPRRCWHTRGVRINRKWVIDDASLDALASSSAWKAWTKNPNRPPAGSGHPRSIYGDVFELDGATFDSADAMRSQLCDNHGGGVPIEVIDAFVAAAGDVEARVHAIAGIVAAASALGRRLGGAVSTKPLREAIWFWWSVPRFDGVPKVRSKYPLSVPWSPGATVMLAAHRADPRAPLCLVLEHTTPLGIHIAHLIDVGDDVDEVRRILHRIDFVVITKDEDEAVTAAGWRTRLPASGNPFDRYTIPGLALHYDQFMIHTA